MTNRRVQVDPGIPQESLQPVASPVDTFARTGAGTKLAQLAQGLAQVSPAVQRFTNLMVDVNNEKQRAAGEAAGEAAARKLAEEGKALAGAQRKGLIPPNKNPFFMAGFREQMGRVTADRWHEHLIADVAQNEALKHSTNLADFEKFAQEHLQHFLKDNVAPEDRDQFFETGFGFRADTYMRQETEDFARGIGPKVEQQSNEALFAETKHHIADALGKHMTPEQMGADLTQLARDMIAQGQPGDQVNRTIARAITAAALEAPGSDGLTALQVLHHVKTGSGALGDTSYGSALFEKAKGDIEDQLHRDNQRRLQQEAEQRQENERNVLGQAITALQQNPNADLRPFITQLRGSPDAIQSLVSLQSNVGSLTYRTDAAVKRDLFSRIWTQDPASPEAVTPSTITRALARGSLTTTDAAWLMGMLQEKANATGAKGSFTHLLTDPAFEKAYNDMAPSFLDPETKLVPADKADAAAYAHAAFSQAWIELHTSGRAAQMTPEQIMTWLSQTARGIVDFEQQGQSFHIKPANVPATLSGGAKPPEPGKAVLAADQLQTIARELQSGSLSIRSMTLLHMYGKDTPSDIAAFLREQATLLGGGTTTPKKTSP